MPDWSSMKKTSGDYLGVLYREGALRIIVTARGASYGIQMQEGQEWADLALAPSSSWLSAMAVTLWPQPSETIFQAIEGLSERPADCGAVPYSGGRRPKAQRKPSRGLKASRRGGGSQKRQSPSSAPLRASDGQKAG
jgi:hypothetical protein